MSTLKVDKLQGRSGSATGLTFSGANGTFGGTLAVTGVHTVGTNAVATSEGGAVTTNITQGLIKAWNRLDGDASTLATNDSFGISGIVDIGVARYTSTFTSTMSNVHYAVSVNVDIGDSGKYAGLQKSISNTTKVNTVIYAPNAAFADADPTMVLVAGDLA